MSCVSSREALAAIRRGDSKVVAQYFRQLSLAMPSSGVSNIIAERGQAGVLRALAEALDPGSLIGPQKLEFNPRKRGRGRPPNQDTLSRRLAFFKDLEAAELANLDHAERRLRKGEELSKAEMLNSKRTLKRVAKDHNYTPQTAAKYAKEIRSLLRKRVKRRRELN